MKLPRHAQQTLVALGAVLATACGASPARAPQKAEDVKKPDAIVSLTGTVENPNGLSFAILQADGAKRGVEMHLEKDGTIKYRVADQKKIDEMIKEAGEKACEKKADWIPPGRGSIVVNQIRSAGVEVTVDTAVNGRPSDTPKTIDCTYGPIGALVKRLSR